MTTSHHIWEEVAHVANIGRHSAVSGEHPARPQCLVSSPRTALCTPNRTKQSVQPKTYNEKCMSPYDSKLFYETTQVEDETAAQLKDWCRKILDTKSDILTKLQSSFDIPICGASDQLQHRTNKIVDREGAKDEDQTEAEQFGLVLEAEGDVTREVFYTAGRRHGLYREQGRGGLVTLGRWALSW